MTNQGPLFGIRLLHSSASVSPPVAPGKNQRPCHKVQAWPDTQGRHGVTPQGSRYHPHPSHRLAPTPFPLLHPVLFALHPQPIPAHPVSPACSVPSVLASPCWHPGPSWVPGGAAGPSSRPWRGMCDAARLPSSPIGCHGNLLATTQLGRTHWPPSSIAPPVTGASQGHWGS